MIIYPFERIQTVDYHFLYFCQFDAFYKLQASSITVRKDDFVLVVINIDDDSVNQFKSIHEWLLYQCRAVKCAFFHVLPAFNIMRSSDVSTSASMECVFCNPVYLINRNKIIFILAECVKQYHTTWVTDFFNKTLM